MIYIKNKLVFTTLIALSVLIAGCGVTKPVNNVQNSTNQSLESDPQTTQNNAKNPSSVSSSSSVTDYSKYTGEWVTENGLRTDYPFGIRMNITVDKEGNLTGSLGNSSGGFSHIAGIEQLKGKIDNHKFICRFDEDGWEHSGTVELDFNEDSITRTVTYDAKSKTDDSFWGIRDGSVKMVKSDTPVKRTISDLREGLWQDVSNQCFNVNLNRYGKIRFLTESNWNAGFNFYLADMNSNILYKFPEYTDEDKYYRDKVNAISFVDLNQDGLKDVIVLYGGLDSNRNSVPVCTLFIQNNDNTFTEDKILEDKVNSSGNNKDIASIVKYVKENPEN